MPPSHGFRGFVAIESVAKKSQTNAGFCGVVAAKGNEEEAKGLKRRGKRGWFWAVFLMPCVRKAGSRLALVRFQKTAPPALRMV